MSTRRLLPGLQLRLRLLSWCCLLLQVKEQLDTVPPFHTNSFKGQLHSSRSRQKLGALEEQGRSLLLDARTESYAPGLQLEVEVCILHLSPANFPGRLIHDHRLHVVSCCSDLLGLSIPEMLLGLPCCSAVLTLATAAHVQMNRHGRHCHAAFTQRGRQMSEHCHLWGRSSDLPDGKGISFRR